MNINESDLPHGNLSAGLDRARKANKHLDDFDCRMQAFLKWLVNPWLLLAVMLILSLASSYRYYVDLRTVREERAARAAQSAQAAQLEQAYSAPAMRETEVFIEKGRPSDPFYLDHLVPKGIPYRTPGLKLRYDQTGDFIPWPKDAQGKPIEHIKAKKWMNYVEFIADEDMVVLVRIPDSPGY